MATLTFDYPTNARLTQILQSKIPQRMSDLSDPLMDLLPFESVPEAEVAWEQKDNYKGLTQLRGYNGAPTKISKVGLSRYIMSPGVYGEYDVIDEFRLTRARVPGTWGQKIDATKLVLESQDQLIDRLCSRVKYISSQLYLNGSFLVTSPDGAVIHRDSYAIRKFTSIVAWTDHVNSTPLADLRSLPILARGYSVNFGRKAKILMNRTTWNNMVSNANAADLGGLFKMVPGGNMGIGSLDVSNMTKLFDQENLPAIEIYEEGYYDETQTFQLFIPDGKAILVGQRSTFDPVAKFLLTANANSEIEDDSSPFNNMYMRVIDLGEKEVPRSIQTHLGFNGGPAVYFPSAAVSMTLF